jgi:hypothetical protein
MYVRSIAIASELEVVLPLEAGANAWTVAAANAAMMNPTFMMTMTMTRDVR